MRRFDTPVLFVVFNRPDVTRKVFSAIRSAKPAKLFISADGPRPGNLKDIKNCLEVQKLVEQVDWDCEVYTNFSPVNLGCKKAVSSGICWFFQHVEAGIILEDDCLPDPSFFSYCETLLDRYRDDLRVMGITGTSLQQGHLRGDGAYYASRVMNVWGWATWRRAWALYDGEMTSYPDFRRKREITKLFPSRSAHHFWIYKFDEACDNSQSWAFPWAFTFFHHQGICLTPNCNLITNIGFGIGGVHADNETSILANLPLSANVDTTPPSSLVPDMTADLFFTYLLAREQMPSLSQRWILRFKKTTRGILGQRIYSIVKQLMNKSI